MRFYTKMRYLAAIIRFRNFFHSFYGNSIRIHFLQRRNEFAEAINEKLKHALFYG